MILSLAKTYTVTAETRDGGTVWCDLRGEWLVLGWEPFLLDHGPHIQDVYDRACEDPNLYRVTITETKGRP